MKFKIEGKTYELKGFDRMTMSDWDGLYGEPIPDDLKAYEKLIEMVSRMTGAPKTKLRKVKPKDMEALLVHMAKSASAMNEAGQKEPPKSFTHKGVEYIVPQDLEQETTYGQWFDLTEVFLPRSEKAIDSHLYSLAVLCTPKGKEYDAADVDMRRALFMKLPVRVGLSVCGFFFDRSQRYRSAISHYLSEKVTSVLRTVEQEVKSSAPVTEPS